HGCAHLGRGPGAEAWGASGQRTVPGYAAVPLHRAGTASSDVGRRAGAALASRTAFGYTISDPRGARAAHRTRDHTAKGADPRRTRAERPARLRGPPRPGPWRQARAAGG